MTNTNLQSYLQRAISAHSWISFSPEERGRQYIEEAEFDLKHLLDSVPEETHEWVAEKYKKLMSHHISSLSRTASSAITGGSGFNVKRQEKMRRWEESSMKAWRDWIKNIKKKLNRIERPSLDTQVEEKIQLIEDLKENHQMMLLGNKIVRNKKLSLEEKKEELQNLGLDEKTVNDLFSNKNWWGQGFAGFELTNSNARIKQHEKTLLELQRRVEARQFKAKEEIINNVKFINNEVDNRLEVHFNGKPGRITIDLLKSNGFRWTPSKGCWQSYLSINHHKLNEVIEHVKSL